MEFCLFNSIEERRENVIRFSTRQGVADFYHVCNFQSAHTGAIATFMSKIHSSRTFGHALPVLVAAKRSACLVRSERGMLVFKTALPDPAALLDYLFLLH